MSHKVSFDCNIGAALCALHTHWERLSPRNLTLSPESREAHMGARIDGHMVIRLLELWSVNFLINIHPKNNNGAMAIGEGPCKSHFTIVQKAFGSEIL